MKWYSKTNTEQGSASNHYYTRTVTVITILCQLPSILHCYPDPRSLGCLSCSEVWRAFPGNRELLCSACICRWGLQSHCKRVQLLCHCISKFLWQLGRKIWLPSLFGFHLQTGQGSRKNQGSLCPSRPWHHASKQGKVNTFS